MRLLKSRRRVIAYVTAFVVIAVLGTGAFTEVVWVGRATIPLEFVILDASTGRPIEGASIRLFFEGNEENPECEAVAGPEGRARVVIQARTVGRDSLFRHTRGVNYNWFVAVTADGHLKDLQYLATLTRAPAYHHDKVPPPIVFRLTPASGSVLKLTL